jgi:hypothetical protein
VQAWSHAATDEYQRGRSRRSKHTVEHAYEFEHVHQHPANRAFCSLRVQPSLVLTLVPQLTLPSNAEEVVLPAVVYDTSAASAALSIPTRRNGSPHVQVLVPRVLTYSPPRCEGFFLPTRRGSQHQKRSSRRPAAVRLKRIKLSRSRAN